MGGHGCLLLDNLEDLFEARIDTVGGDTCEETQLKASMGSLISRIGLRRKPSSTFGALLPVAESSGVIRVRSDYRKLDS